MSFLVDKKNPTEVPRFFINYVSPANPIFGVKASVSNESGQFRASEGKEIKGAYRGGGLR
jgi:hypothetical protein